MKEKSLGYNTYEKVADEYTDEEGYICNEIDIYPVTYKQQSQLKQLFDILEINVSPKLFGHTKLFIATKEINIDNLKDINAKTSTSHNIDYDSESKKDSTPQGEVCPRCDGEGKIKVIETGTILSCGRCKGSDKLSHNQ
jgi:hypothetical protein